MKTAYSYIRFSTPDQLKGDSLRRQLEATDNYCKANNLTLDTSLNLRDLGLSAFHGKHKTKGALGEFLQLVKQEKIEPGSVLIVENLDRLSREEILTALNQFTGIIDAGIKLVTLQDGMAYDKQSITDNWTQLIISITYMARAHEESATKSKRLKAAWENKRNKAVTENIRMTRKAPAWVRLSDDKKYFILIPVVCKAIELMYQMKLKGKGSEAIAKSLNEMPEIWRPPVSKRNKTGGWRASYVNKLLWNNRELLGEYQPHKTLDGKRVPVGEPIKDYFPSAIEEDLFYAVQQHIKENRKVNGNAGGKTGKASNLFTHVAKCGLCGAPLHYIDKGAKPKGGQYLHCDRSRRKLGCNAKTIRYDEFLRLFMQDFDELDITQFVSGKDEQQAEINLLERSIEVNRYKIYELEKRLKILRDRKETETDPEEIQDTNQRIADRKEERMALMDSIKENQQKLSTLKGNGKQLQNNIEQVKHIFQLMDDAKTEQELIDIRMHLKAQIRRICRKIKIYPLQEKAPEIEEVEPGIIRWTNSERIKKIVIQFNGVKKLRILQCQGYSEL